MKTLFDPQRRQDILDRLARLGPNTERRWGTMSVEAMIHHVGRQLRVALGELEVPEARGPLKLPGLRWLVIRVLPWPHGTKTAPQLVATSPEDFGREGERTRELIERFADGGPAADFSPHPLFGKLPAKLWGQLAYRHLDYHLKQFGC